MICLDLRPVRTLSTGFDEVAVTLEKREIPGTGSSEADTSGPAAVLNLYLPQAPTAEQADTLQYFRGEREPAPDDPSLAETQADSLAFAGQINGLQAEITLLNFAGLTAQADTLTARIRYTIAGVQTSQDLTFTETGPETRLFRIRFTDPTPETLEANIYLPVSPTPEAADSLQYYYGARSPLPDDPVLSEAEPASLIFRGTVQGVNTTIAIDPATFHGLTPNVDSLHTTITLSFEAAIMPLRAELNETAAGSGMFQTGLGSAQDSQAHWSASISGGEWSNPGTFAPMAVRIMGPPEKKAYRLMVEGTVAEVGTRPEGPPDCLLSTDCMALFAVDGIRSILTYDRVAGRAVLGPVSGGPLAIVEPSAGQFAMSGAPWGVPGAATLGVASAGTPFWVPQVVLAQTKAQGIGSRLGEILGLRAHRSNEAVGGEPSGKIDPETDPSKGGRLYIDTQETWDGGELVPAHYDRQRVRITVVLDLPANVADQVLAQFRVVWRLYDPDDPAGGNSGAGGDNTGKKHENNAHWFVQADHAISDQKDLDTKAPNKRSVLIGGARTAVSRRAEGAFTSTVFFCFSDDGGDNYLVEAELQRQEGNQVKRYPGTVSGLLTVWRRRSVKVYAMASTEPLQGYHYPVEASCITRANPRPIDRDAKAKLALLRQAVNQAFASKDANTRCYLDLVCDNAVGAPDRTLSCRNVPSLETESLWRYMRDLVDGAHTGAGNPPTKHADNAYTVMGVSSFSDGMVTGNSVIAPHAFVKVPHWHVYSVTVVTSHELAHLIFPGVVHMHKGHSDGWGGRCLCMSPLDAEGDKRMGDNRVNQLCPRHAKVMRLNATRSWPDHVVGQGNAVESARDSDP